MRRLAPALATALLAVVATFVAPGAARAQSTPSSSAPTTQVGAPSTQPRTTVAGDGEEIPVGGTAKTSTPSAGSGVVVAVGALILLALGVAAFVTSRRKRLRDLGIS
jgi:hypothetical protein